MLFFCLNVVVSLEVCPQNVFVLSYLLQVLISKLAAVQVGCVARGGKRMGGMCRVKGMCNVSTIYEIFMPYLYEFYMVLVPFYIVFTD